MSGKELNKKMSLNGPSFRDILGAVCFSGWDESNCQLSPQTAAGRQASIPATQQLTEKAYLASRKISGVREREALWVWLMVSITLGPGRFSIVDRFRRKVRIYS